MFLLDTNVVSEFRRAKPHGAVIAWMAGIREEHVFVPSIVLGEIQSGIESTRKNDVAKALELEVWLDRLSATLQVIPADGPIMRCWARLAHGRSRELSEDAIVAATAMVRGWTVATRNVKDFARFGVPLVNPFGPCRS